MNIIDKTTWSDNHNVPAWIDEDITPNTIAAVIQGGCASGAYMPAVTYHTALEIMSEHGDDVLDYINERYGELPKPSDDESWSGMAVFYLSCAVELWASSMNELEDWENDEPLADLIIDATVMTYTVGWNMPGYMPDADPCVFTDYDTAKRSLIESMLRHADEESDENIAESLTNIAEEVNLENEEIGFNCGPFFYFLNDSTHTLDELVDDHDYNRNELIASIAEKKQ